MAVNYVDIPDGTYYPGDTTQIDLPKNVTSGLIHVSKVLSGMDDIGFTHFSARDVVRHPLVQRIVTAYQAAESVEQHTGRQQ